MGAAGPGDQSTQTSSAFSCSKAFRNVISPLRIRVFAVPSGACIRSAIAVCVSPPNHARSMASRCSRLSACSARRSYAASSVASRSCRCSKHVLDGMSRVLLASHVPLVAVGRGLHGPHAVDRTAVSDRAHPRRHRPLRGLEVRCLLPDLQVAVLRDLGRPVGISHNPENQTVDDR